MHDVVIIGAGFAGLQAANTLIANGLSDIVVLEARDRVGGRTKPGKIAGLDIDLGGMWLGPSQKRLAKLANDFGVSTYPTYLEGKSIFRIGGKAFNGEREDYTGIFSIRDGLDFFLADRKIKSWLRDFEPESPWSHPDADALDSMTLEAWINKTFNSVRLKSMFRLVSFSLLCAEASQVSMLFFLHYLKCGEGLDILTSADEGGAQNLLFEGGVHQIAVRMSERLEGKLRLNQAVQRIERNESGVTVQTQDRSFDAKAAIIAVPATLVTKIEFAPPLPQLKQTLHNRLNMGSAIKFWVAYETPFWREQGLNGTIVDDRSPASPCFDVTPPYSKLGLLVGFFDGDHALANTDKSRAERQEIVLQLLAKHFGDRALQPVDYQDCDWTIEQWSNGCYGAFAPTGVYSNYGRFLRPPVGNLYWAGTETATQWTGYIEGALQSGERAAVEAAACLKRI